MSNSLCDQGKTLLAQNHPEEARDTYNSATNRDSSNARAWNGLGVAQDMLGKTEAAEASYRKALSLAPDSLVAANNLAHLLIARHESTEAIALLEPLAGSAFFTAPMRANLAEAYVLAGRDEDAEKMLRINLTLDQAKRRMAAFRAERAMLPMRDGGVYADLGSYPTEAMAQGFVTRTRALADGKADAWVFSITPDVKVSGGTPLFAVRVTGASPKDVCDYFNAQAVPCVPAGK